jgi:hypothetical protein
MNAEALARTRETGRTHFWSRTRKALWQKGETSGHVQHVRSITVNCYENCLLIQVQQIGACCHTGYPSCFYRELDRSGNLVMIRDRSFDPADVYSGPSSRGSVLATWVGAYRWLADHDVESSQTSRHLHSSDLDDLGNRVADELAELAGVLSGDHGHTGQSTDIVLEGSQVLYWGVLTAIRAGLSNEQIIGSFTAEPGDQDVDLANSLLAESQRWKDVAARQVGERLGAVVQLVSAAAATIDVDLPELLEHDLVTLRSRPYLRDYFAAVVVGDDTNS